MSKGKVTVVTHSSKFHTDDIFAVAALLLVLEKDYEIEIIRSRDMAIIEKADYVVDVGGRYDFEKNRFDHHQIGGAGKREKGIPYASFGLVWKKFGEKLTGSIEGAEKVDKEIVQPIDANDNGVQFLKTTIYGLFPFDIGSLTGLFSPTWKETDADLDKIFMELVSYAKVIIKRKIISVQDAVEGAKLVLDIYNKTSDKRLIVVDERYPWEEVLSKFPEPLFAIYKNRDNNWSLKAVRSDLLSYDRRKDLPKEWAGKRDQELIEASGVSGSVFCHNNLFLAVNKTKEGILKMAEIAINS
jgi:uncharacterized UPF0160 family protein